MSNNMKLAIEIVVNGAKAAGDAIKGLGDAFRDGLRDGATAELAKTGKSLDDLVKQASEARKTLDLKPHAEIHGEISKVKAAYEALKTSGVASASEVAQAYVRAQEKIIDLKHQTNGLADAFGKVRASAAAVAAGFAGDAAAVGKSFDFEKATVQIDKLANLGPEGLARIRAEIRALATEIPISAEGLAKIGESAAQLNLPVEDYQAFISLVAKSASAFDIPVNAAGEAFGKLKKNFQLNLGDLSLVADSFNLLADSIANVKEGDLLNFTERMSAQGKAFGLTAQQVGALGASLLSAGKAPEVAARAMESMLVKLQTADKAGEKFQLALEQMGLTGKKLADDIEKGPQQALTDFMQRLSGLSDRQRTSVLQDLFGADFASEVNILAQNFNGYADALGKVADKSKYAGNVEEAFRKDATTGSDQWQLAKQAVEEFARTVGDALSPMAKVLIQVFRDLAVAVTWLAKEFPTLTAVVAVGGPLLMGLSALKLAAAGINLVLAKMIEGLLGSGVAAKIAVTGIKSALGVLGAAFVGWEIGTYLRNEFVEVRLFGIAMVRGLLLAFEQLKYGFNRGWEGISYAAALMWETIKFAFDKSIAVIKGKFGDMVASIGRGMASIPGLKDEAQDVIAYGESLKKSAAAMEDWNSRMARLNAGHAKAVADMKAEHSKEIGQIKSITDAMANDEIMAEAAKKAKALAVPVGRDMAAGVAQGIEEGSPEAVAAMTKLVQDLEASARKESETHSPSQAYARFGGDLIDGWVNGMVDRMEDREAEIAALARKTAELLTRHAAADAVDVIHVGQPGYVRNLDGTFGTRAMDDLVRGVQKASGPITAAFEQYGQSVGDFADNMREAFSRGIKGMEDALVDFVRTGTINFRALADSIIADMVRIAIQESVTKPLASAMSSFNWASLFGYAQGGAPGGVSRWKNQIVDRPTFFAFASGGVMGEAGPEAIMPLTRRNGRLGVDASGAAEVTVNVINNASGTQAMTRERSDGGMRVIDVMIEQVEAGLAGSVMRGSGPLPAALARAYGLNRAAGAY